MVSLSEVRAVSVHTLRDPRLGAIAEDIVALLERLKPMDVAETFYLASFLTRVCRALTQHVLKYFR